jgi:hypothetical protein
VNGVSADGRTPGRLERVGTAPELAVFAERAGFPERANDTINGDVMGAAADGAPRRRYAGAERDL